LRRRARRSCACTSMARTGAHRAQAERLALPSRCPALSGRHAAAAHPLLRAAGCGCSAAHGCPGSAPPAYDGGRGLRNRAWAECADVSVLSRRAPSSCRATPSSSCQSQGISRCAALQSPHRRNSAPQAGFDAAGRRRARGWAGRATGGRTCRWARCGRRAARCRARSWSCGGACRRAAFWFCLKAGLGLGRGWQELMWAAGLRHPMRTCRCTAAPHVPFHLSGASLAEPHACCSHAVCHTPGHA